MNPEETGAISTVLIAQVSRTTPPPGVQSRIEAALTEKLNMARIAGVDLPGNKQVRIALTYICGIGGPRSLKILEKARDRPVCQDGAPSTRIRSIRSVQVIEAEGRHRERSPQGNLAQHQAPDRNSVLSWSPSPPVASCPRPAHPHQRSHRKGPRMRTVAGKK